MAQLASETRQASEIFFGGTLLLLSYEGPVGLGNTSVTADKTEQEHEQKSRAGG
jgi:hypothetical protein